MPLSMGYCRNCEKTQGPLESDRLAWFLTPEGSLVVVIPEQALRDRR